MNDTVLLKEIIRKNPKEKRCNLIDETNELLASIRTDTTRESASYTYGHCEVLRDNIRDGHRVIQIKRVRRGMVE